MNSRERVMATLQGQSPDHRALLLCLSLYGAKMTGRPLLEHYTIPEAYAEGQGMVLAEFQPDVALAPFCLNAEGEAFGSTPRYFDRQPPALKRPAARSLDEALALPLPDVDSHPRLLYIRETTRLLVARHGAATPVAVPVLTPMDLPALLIGTDAWIETLLFDIDGARRLLDLTTRFFLAWTSALFRDGADFMIFPMVFANPLVVTRRVCDEIAAPCLKNAFAASRGPLVIHHGGSPFEPFLSACPSLPNVVAIMLDEQDDPTATRTLVGPATTLMSGLMGPTLGHLEPNRIGERYDALLASMKTDRHFMACTCGPDMPLNTPPECIHAIRRAILTSGAPA